MPITAWTAILSGGLSLLLALVIAALAARRRSSESWLLRAPLLALVLAVVLGLVALYSALLLIAFDAPDFKLPVAANIASPVLVAATLIAGALTAAYAVLRLRAHLLAEEKGRLDARGDVRADDRHRSDLDVAVTQRFAKAVELLAADHSISRVAGAHLLLALGDEWPSGAQRCLDVLISHLRGLNEGRTADAIVLSRGVREEVRLITRGILARLGRNPSAWDVKAGDFSGAALADFDLTDLRQVQTLDLREARVMGDLSIPMGVSGTSPRLAGVICEGSLTLTWSETWRDIELLDAQVAGSVTVAGKVLTGGINAVGIHADGDFGLGFGEVHGDITLDSAVIGGNIAVGSPEIGALFGVEMAEPTPSAPDRLKPATLSLVGASFRTLSVRRSRRGPRLDLAEATGAVDLSGSTFPFEVTGSQLDASTGFAVKNARFDSALVLDGALVPDDVDLEGIELSSLARSAIESSEFALRDRMLSHDSRRGSPTHGVTEVVESFDWQDAIEPIRDHISEDFMREIERRLGQLQDDLPLDWSSRPTFTARVMSEVSRAAAIADTPTAIESLVHNALRSRLKLSTSEKVAR